MSDGGEEVQEVQSGNLPALPKEVLEQQGQIKLFNKWTYEDVEIRDISLTYGVPTSLIAAMLQQRRSLFACCHENKELKRNLNTEITSKSAPPFTSPTLPVGLRSSAFEKPNAPSSSD
jgi:hypothetical protein